MSVDAYCERLGPGLWAEPLNALTNLAFLVAALLLLRRQTPASLRALPVLLALVGLASLSFHTFATALTGALDSAFIAVFVLYYVVVFAHHYRGIRWSRAWLAAPAFVVSAVAVGLLVRVGPGIYLPALLALLVLAPLAGRDWAWFAGAAGVFAVSLTLRTLDEPLCGSIPSGTHFLWHVLNAVTLWLVSEAVIRRARAASRS
ncbi:hypothetical protein SAMN05216188_11070 [Lentzea xinjiangensis]|uniref:Ceramidase n=1 Tax=Lentzea xinjiangensis TaxID=402600 RepID=A0A1H9N7Q5_9PSEU|nr:hypothetical protein [Lentzea xinjiangensis]SER31952.1 hypothetical protein SAMN05216188_11070 [Lentzea xinjiangensis]